MTQLCPCQSGLSYTDCCQLFHTKQKIAPTAETLMRSRYSAYALHLPKYLCQTWHRSTRPSCKKLKEKSPYYWVGLKIIDLEKGQCNDTIGIVEFIATYEYEGQLQEMRERSNFVKQDGKWFYK